MPPMNANLTYKNSLILLLHVVALFTPSSGTFTLKYITYWNILDCNSSPYYLTAIMQLVSTCMSINTLATGYGDFRTSVAKRRRRATEISVFPYRWMEEGVGFVMC